MSMILDVNTEMWIKALSRIAASKNNNWYSLSDESYINRRKLRNLISRKNDIFFLIKVKKDGITNNWEIYQVTSDDKEKVINFLDKNYDEYEIIFSCAINKVYRIE